MELYTAQTDEITRYQAQIEELKNLLQFLLKHYRPLFHGEIFLSGNELCQRLHISKRTLQQYRDDGFLPYIQIEGKILYKESDILRILEGNYRKV